MCRGIMTKCAQPDLESAARSITTLLNHVNRGSDAAFGRLVDAVYDDLRRVAIKRMRREFDCPLAALTESPTAVVHQAILKLREQRAQWKDADHFFAIATRLLGYVIGDYKKRRLAIKRGPKRRNLGHHDIPEALTDKHLDEPSEEAIDAFAIISALHERHPRKAEVVTLHALAGRSMPETARMIGVSLPTAERDWKFARAWIRDYFRANGVSM
jgi:RNA polymerase sigma factor (TIGR02999 family)